MIVWVDAQISPALARWITETFSTEVYAVRDLGLRDANDAEIFQAARRSGAIVMTKDRDFVALLDRFGPPPQILWVTWAILPTHASQRFWARACRRLSSYWNRGSRLSR